jgi:hypothetical protein
MELGKMGGAEERPPLGKRAQALKRASNDAAADYWRVSTHTHAIQRL